MDHLRDALKAVFGEPAPGPAAGKGAAEQPAFSLPDPYASDWIALLGRLGGDARPGGSLGQLTQRSDAHVRALKASGRGREAAALKKAREDFHRERERAAWAGVKARFAVLELPEKAYRALKQEEADPVGVLAKLKGERGEELRGAGAARVRDALS